MLSSYLICGFGHLGEAVANASLSHLRPQDITVVEQDFSRSERARLRGFRSICGDASDPKTLRIAHAGVAADLIICTDEPSASKVVKLARVLAPSTARIQVGTRRCEHRAALIAAGADAVIVTSRIAGELLADSVHA